jgi:predicted kinase
MVGGTPGTGKSTVAAGLASRRDWVLLRSDVVRKELAGLDPVRPAPSELGTGLYTPDATRRTYEELLRRAKVALELGQMVVVDASWSDSRFRTDAAALAAQTTSDLVELRCDVDVDVADGRVRQRRLVGGDPSDADPEIADALRARFEAWPSAALIDTSGTPERAIDHALAVAAVGPTT